MKNMTLTSIILVVTATVTALIAGLYYAYSCSVNGGLGRLPDMIYLQSMQSINRVILNPAFLFSFMGTLFLLPLSAYLNYAPASPRFILLTAAALVYAIGSFGVTIAGNVPLNDALDAFNLQSASAEELANMRTHFEAPWNKLHSIRTYATIVSLVLVIVACLCKPALVSEAN